MKSSMLVHIVGKKINELTLYDMSGNLSDVCWIILLLFSHQPEKLTWS